MKKYSLHHALQAAKQYDYSSHQLMAAWRLVENHSLSASAG